MVIFTVRSTHALYVQDTTYSSDAVHEVTGKLGGVAIAAGANEGSSYTSGKRVRVGILPNVPFTNQRYLVYMVRYYSFKP